MMTQMGELIFDQILPADHQLNLAVYAVRTDLKMKTFEWVRETLRSAVCRCCRDAAPLSKLRPRWEDAESIAFALQTRHQSRLPARGQGQQMRRLPRSSPTPKKSFWRELRAHYDEFTEFLASNHRGCGARCAERQKWRDLLGKVGWDAITLALDDMDGNAVALERQTAAYKNFRDGHSRASHQPRQSGGARHQSQGQKSGFRRTCFELRSAEQLSLL